MKEKKNSTILRGIRNDLREFMQLESAGGIILFIAAITALIIANSPLDGIYHMFLDFHITVGLGTFEINKPMELWINDGLMAIFFLLVGLEIKRELIEGELNSVPKAMLPVIAAFGGILAPAIIYALFNYDDPNALKGWAIPAATDIAFALGVLTLLGSRVPAALKIFLTAIAIIDDLAAILIIVLFYSGELAYNYLGYTVAAIVILFLLNRAGIKKLSFYLIFGVLLWAFILKSGVHATLAGVILAFLIPLNVTSDKVNMTAEQHGKSPGRWLEHELHPWVAFGVLPIFAFANAGVSLAGVSFSSLFHPIPLGIILGLFVGKQIGIFTFCWLAIKLKIAAMPGKLTWLEIYAMAVTSGIGFTMSLFIGNLAFVSAEFDVLVRVGVFAGSLISGVMGYLLLRFTGMLRAHRTQQLAE